VVDVIKQHHGTSLVRYFYHRAVEASRAPFAKTTAARGKNAPADPLAIPAALMPSESVFRYDGPRPQSKESAIISLADGVEAASRSLHHVTVGEIDGIIDRIVAERIADGQLNEAPLTLHEITQIKQSFQFTLLNMLHSRVAYPPAEKPPLEAKA
jgi:membrane-associated HD superfamily phosphohydrolase